MFGNTNSASQNPPTTTYYVISPPNFLNLNFIINEIEVSIFDIDTFFTQSSSDYSLKITRNSDNVVITNFDNTEGNEWIPIQLSTTDEETVLRSTNDFIIQSSSFTETLYYASDTAVVPNTPYIYTLNDDIPCTLSFRKNNYAEIKSLPINIKYIQT
jgi:hypothetical protein